MLTVSCVLVNTLHQNDGKRSVSQMCLVCLAKECVSDVRHIKEAIWIRRRAPNTMNRDEGAHYLSHVYDPLLATPTSGNRRNRRSDQVPSF